MKEIVQINSSKVIRVENEKIAGVLLDFRPLKNDDSVCDIGDLNKASLQIAVYRNGSKRPEYFCDDDLDYILRALTAGSMRYTVATTKRATGYLIAIGFGGSLNLTGMDYMEIKLRVQNTTFTALDIAKSSILVETVPTKSNNPVLTIIDSVNYITGDNGIDKSFPNNVIKAVFVHDLANDYLGSAKAKITNDLNLSASGFVKSASENLLIAENLMALQNNPETELKDLVIYNDPNLPLVNPKLYAKFNKAIDSEARIMLLRRKIF